MSELDEFVRLLEASRMSVRALSDSIAPYVLLQTEEIVLRDTLSGPPSVSLQMQQDIYDALAALSPKLSSSYAQVYLDLSDNQRQSWAGTAHEVREILATMLRMLAPDDAVQNQHWFKPETDNKRPTQKQRVRYILRQRRSDSTEEDVVEQVEVIEERVEDLVGSLVRSTYARASDAAHRSKSRTEAGRILLYFEAFAHDLLDLE